VREIQDHAHSQTLVVTELIPLIAVIVIVILADMKRVRLTQGNFNGE
jgi:hypothetical protein